MRIEQGEEFKSTITSCVMEEIQVADFLQEDYSTKVMERADGMIRQLFYDASSLRNWSNRDSSMA